MDINRKASLVARKELFIQAQPHAVWKIHTGINAWSRWQQGISSLSLRPSG